jgi:hypothetical protein
MVGEEVNGEWLRDGALEWVIWLMAVMKQRKSLA